MIAQVSYGSCLMCEIPKGAAMGHSTFRPLDTSRDQHIYSELLEDNHFDALHALGVHPIRNQFWQFSVSNGSKFPVRFRVRFHPKPDGGNGSYHTKNPAHWKWAGFPPKTWHFKFTILAPIKYLSSDRIMT